MADILIRGMEMPQNCFNCSTKIDPDNRRCKIDGHVFEETLGKLTCGRDCDCPLHKLPEHGDLIDRDALYALMEKYTDYGGATEPHDENQIHRDSVLFAIETAPVIVPSNKEETK